jgi:hypothetical protein
VRIYVTIPIEVRIDGKAAAVLTTPEPHDLVASLTERLTRWDDGRYSFQTEMIAAGLHEAVQGAVSDVVHHDTQIVFGNQMVPVFEPRMGVPVSSISRSVKEASDILKQSYISARALLGEIEVTKK